MRLRNVTRDDQRFFDDLFADGSIDNRFIDSYKNINDWLRQADGVKRFALIAELVGEKIGFVDIKTDGLGNCGFMFGVTPGLRGRGMGARVLAEIEKFCTQLGAKNIYCEIDDRNIRSIKMLDRRGYTVVAQSGGRSQFGKVL